MSISRAGWILLIPARGLDGFAVPFYQFDITLIEARIDDRTSPSVPTDHVRAASRPGQLVTERKQYLLRIDPDLYRALETWAADELRSVNAQIEYLLTDAVRKAGRTSTNSKRKREPKEGSS